MNEGKLFELLGKMRQRYEAEPGAQYPHPGGLTYHRAHQLARNLVLMTEQEKEHISGCRRCEHLLDSFRNLKPEEVEDERRVLLFRDFLKVLPFVVVPPILNWFFSSYQSISSTLAKLDTQQLLEQRLLLNGLALCFLITLAGLGLRWFGLIRRARLVIPAMVVSFLMIVGASLLIVENKKAQIRRDLDALFLEHRWIAYEPPDLNPYPGKKRMPSEDQLRDNLERLHSRNAGGGFDGLITFSSEGTSSEGTLAELPRLAKQVGFKAVIMGIYIPKDKEGNPVKPDLQAAIDAKEWVDGYCFGHNPSRRLDFTTLAEWMAELRNATGKPVTTTAPLDSYLGDHGQQLRAIGDWYFPDAHGSWGLGATPKEILRETREFVRNATLLPRDKPVLLKMISYPSAGGPGLTEEAQAEFYTEVCRLALPQGIYVSFFAGYDLPWKRHEDHPDEWSKPEEHVGLFTADGRPKLAVEVVRKGFPVQYRP